NSVMTNVYPITREIIQNAPASAEGIARRDPSPRKPGVEKGLLVRYSWRRVPRCGPRASGEFLRCLSVRLGRLFIAGGGIGLGTGPICLFVRGIDVERLTEIGNGAVKLPQGK